MKLYQCDRCGRTAKRGRAFVYSVSLEQVVDFQARPSSPTSVVSARDRDYSYSNGDLCDSCASQLREHLLSWWPQLFERS